MLFAICYFDALIKWHDLYKLRKYPASTTAVIYLIVYWLDSLSSEVYRLPLRHTKLIRVTAVVSFISLSILTTSSLYLSQQADEVYSLNNNQIKRFAFHPWWKDFYQQHEEERRFSHSLLTQNQEEQNTFLAKQIRQTAKKPTPSAYQTLIKLALETNNETIAKQIRDEAKGLFPTYDFKSALKEQALLDKISQNN